MASTHQANVKTTENGLRFSGVLDHQSVPDLLAKLPSLSLAETTKDIRVDLSEVSKIDSAGLAFLIYWRNQYLTKNFIETSAQAAARNDRIVLTGSNPQSRQLIEIMGLSDFFDLA